MATVKCPKCGFEQDDGAECLRCGVVFERYRALQQSIASSVPPAILEESSPGAFRRFYRIFRWVALAMIVVVVVLVLRKSDPPRVDSDPRAARRVEIKLRELQEARAAGEPHTLRLAEAEINSWMTTRLVLKSPEAPAPAPPEARAEGLVEPEPTIEEVQSSMRDIKIDLIEDGIRAYVVFDFRGKDLSLLLEGRLRAEEGYLRLEPSGGKLGSLPLPQAALERAVQRLFNSPENKEKFRLPPEISDIRIERGELLVSYK